MKILGFIPARGGSKGIPKKNIIPFKGKPLIYYTLRLVKKLNKSVYPFVSSDDQKIINYCNSQNITTVYKRPKKYSKDSSLIIDSVNHSLKWLYKNKNLKFDIVLLLQPTSPKRNFNEFKRAIQFFKKNKLESLVGVSKMKEHPNECIELKKNKKWKFLASNQRKVQRQKYNNNYYFLDGSLYMATTKFLKKNKSFVKENYTFLFKLNNEFSVDIDNKIDLKVLNAIY